MYLRVDASLAQALKEHSQRGCESSRSATEEGNLVRGNSICNIMELRKLPTRNAHCGREVEVGRSDHCSLKLEAWVTGQTEFSL